MTPEAFEAAALALPGAGLSIQWGEDRVFKVGGKMFAVLAPGGDRCSFKASEIAFAALTESGRARPAPYLARASWVYFDDLAALDGDEVAAWLAQAHGLVAAGLTRRARVALGLA